MVVSERALVKCALQSDLVQSLLLGEKVLQLSSAVINTRQVGRDCFEGRSPEIFGHPHCHVDQELFEHNNQLLILAGDDQSGLDVMVDVVIVESCRWLESAKNRLSDQAILDEVASCSLKDVDGVVRSRGSRTVRDQYVHIVFCKVWG
jgi:hypothetical protein